MSGTCNTGAQDELLWAHFFCSFLVSHSGQLYQFHDDRLQVPQLLCFLVRVAMIYLATLAWQQVYSVGGLCLPSP